jgi:hypothetical protein
MKANADPLADLLKRAFFTARDSFEEIAQPQLDQLDKARVNIASGWH